MCQQKIAVVIRDTREATDDALGRRQPRLPEWPFDECRREPDDSFPSIESGDRNHSMVQGHEDSFTRTVSVKQLPDRNLSGINKQ